MRAVLPPGQDSPYRGNYASLPVVTLKPPSEGNRTVPVVILWQRDGVSPSYTIHFNARAQQVVSLSQIAALHIDNTQCSSTINIVFPDTQFQLQLGPNSEGFYPVVTNSLEFYAYIDLAPTVNDRSVIQVLNFLPPPIEFGSAGGQGVGAGTVRQVDTVAPLQGGPITDQGTLSLTTPLSLNIGGTGATTANAALDNLATASGATAGSLVRSAGGIWSVSVGAGTGTISAVNPGTGLTGGGTSGAVTLGLAVPVTVANGGSGATSAAQALTNLGAAPLAAPAFTGAPTAPTATAGTNNTQLATTAFVNAATATAGGAFVPLSGSVPMTGALNINMNTAPQSSGAAQLAASAADGAGAVILAQSFGTGITTQFAGRAARGTGAAPTTVQANDILAAFSGIGYQGSGYFAGAQMISFAAENWTAAARGSRISFNTTPLGATAQTTPLTLGAGLLVGPAAADPGLGWIQATGSILLQTNAQGLFGRDTGATTRSLISLAADNFVYLGYGNATISNGSILPLTANTFDCGAAGNAWRSVMAFAFPLASDLRLKTDIAELPACLDLVQAIEPKRYKFNNASDADKDRVRWGFVAQDVAGAMQSAGHDFGGHFVGEDEEESQSLSYDDLTAVLWKAVRELSEQVAELKAKVQQ